jgi:hypothetical protein
MRYFTRAWCAGECPDEEAAAVVAAYEQHLDEISPHLTPELHALSRISLHDAHFKAVDFDQPMRQLRLVLRCGDRQVGYFDLSLRYDDVTIVDKTPKGIVALANDPRAEVLYDEVGLFGEAHFEHRLILWPDGEVALQFSALTLARADVS